MSGFGSKADLNMTSRDFRFLTRPGPRQADFAVMQNRRGGDLVGHPGLEAVRDPSPIKAKS
jgi:hypothetical protein